MMWFHSSGLLLGVFLPLCATADYVPVVFWTNIRAEECKPDVPVIPAEYMLKFSESEYFKCLQRSNPSLVKIFLTDELDGSDFSLVRDEDSGQKAFTNLQNILAATTSITMPAVQPSSSSSFVGTTLKNAFKEADISLVELPKIKRESIADMHESISRLDGEIREEMSKIPSEDRYIAILTASSSPQRIPRSVSDVFVGRQLLAEEEDPQQSNRTFFKYEDCIYIIYNNLTLQYQKDTLSLTGPTVISGACNEADNTASIDLKFSALNRSQGDDNNDIKLSLSFFRWQSPVSLDTWWNITSAILTHNLNTTTASYNMKILDRYQYTAPKNWSWVCAAPDSIMWTGGTKDQPIVQQLRFEFLQMQVFDITNSSFSRALDCSGFLTAPIWMGTVISLLLATIFAFGLKALVAVSTMDRFDDPKGKSISVHTHDS